MTTESLRADLSFKEEYSKDTSDLDEVLNAKPSDDSKETLLKILKKNFKETDFLTSLYVNSQVAITQTNIPDTSPLGAIEKQRAILIDLIKITKSITQLQEERLRVLDKERKNPNTD